MVCSFLKFLMDIIESLNPIILAAFADCLKQEAVNMIIAEKENKKKRT
jgi:hypothetical protein